MINRLQELRTYSSKYRILNKLNNWGLLKPLNLMLSTVINNRKYKIPCIGGIGLSNLVIQESWMNHFLNEFKNYFSEAVVLDVGVNIGQTLLKVKSIAPECSYIGFEPNPHCQSYLIKLIESNKIYNTAIIPVAIADQTTIIELLFDNESPVDSSAGINLSYRSGIKRKINVLTLNPSDLKSLKENRIGLIKIDVEGAELEVLNGLKEIIEQNKPIIFIEILPVYTIENKERLYRQNKIQDFIDSLEYQIYRVNETSSKLYPIEGLDVHDNLSMCNYILKPKG